MAKLHPGQSAPLATITPTDHGGYILIANSLCLCLVLAGFALRIHIRRHIRPPFSYDDILLIIAMAVTIVQTIITFALVPKGYGRAIDELSEASLTSIEKLLYSSDILFVLGIYLTKISGIFFIIRLTPDRVQLQILRGFLGLTTALTVASVFMVALRCQLSTPWVQFTATCSGIYTRWAVIAAFDIAVEVGLFVTAVYLIWGLKMSVGKKGKVLIAFGLRLFMIAFSGARLYQLHKQTVTKDPTLVAALVSVWTQIELHYANIACTIPCLNPFMSAVSTGFGAFGEATISGKEYAYGSGYGSGGSGQRSGNRSGNRSQNRSHNLSSNDNSAIRSQTFARRSRAENDAYELGMRPIKERKRSDSKSRVAAKKGDQDSIETNDSRQMIIKKVVGWTVHSHETPGSKSDSGSDAV